MSKYQKLYICSESKFMGTSKMFLDKGVDVFDTDNTTIYCVDDPEELSIIRNLDSTTGTLEFTDLELNEEYKTAKVFPVIKDIPEEVKNKQTEDFKNSFQNECVNLLNITQHNPLMQIYYKEKWYSTNVNLASLWLIHLMTKNIRIVVDEEGYLEYKFREGVDYHIYLTDEAGVTDKHIVDATTMDHIFSTYLDTLKDTIEHTTDMYDKINEYKYEDICRYNFK